MTVYGGMETMGLAIAEAFIVVFGLIFLAIIVSRLLRRLRR